MKTFALLFFSFIVGGTLLGVCGDALFLEWHRTSPNNFRLAAAGTGTLAGAVLIPGIMPLLLEAAGRLGTIGKFGRRAYDDANEAEVTHDPK